MGRLLVAALLASTVAVGAARAENTPSPEDAKAYIVWPKNGQIIRGGKLWVRMGVRNMGVAPAGTTRKNTGHHHLILDAELPSLDDKIPSDRNHLHFGGGQTEARLTDLPPGKHTLQMIMGDAEHVPHKPPLFSKQITIIVPE